MDSLIVLLCMVIVLILVFKYLVEDFKEGGD